MIHKSKIKYGVFLLSAGYGSRLHPITVNIPKPLVKVKNIPILENWLNIFNNLNHPPHEILINTHHLKN